MFIADEHEEKWSWPCTVSLAESSRGAEFSNIYNFFPQRNLVLSLCEAGFLVTSFVWNVLDYSGYSESNRNRTVIGMHTKIC